MREAAVGPPEDPRRERLQQRIAATGAHAEREICLLGLERTKELDHEARGLLQIGGHGGEVAAAGMGQAGSDRRERAKVAGVGKELRDERAAREGVSEESRGLVGAAVVDEDDLQAMAERAVELTERVEQARQRLPLR